MISVIPNLEVIEAQQKVNSIVELIAEQQADLIDGYIKIHVRKPPHMPVFIFNYFVKRCVIIKNFKTNS